MKTSFILFLISFSFNYSFASFGEEWVSRYNGSANNADYCYDMKVDASGNVFVTGYATNQSTGRDMVTIKYDNNGNMLWLRSFNGTNNGGDYAFALVLDQYSNVYVTGRADMQQGISNYATIKYDANGVQQWIAFYDGPAGQVDEARAIFVDAAGNVYVTGRSRGISGLQDIATVKYNSQGVQLWAAVYNGPGNNDDIGNAVIVDPSGNVYVTGNSIGNSSGDDYVTIKYDGQGNVQWVKRYNGSGNGGDVAVGIKPSPDFSAVYVTGFAFGGAATSYDYVTIKYNASDGNELWTKVYNSQFSLGDFARALTVDNSGNIIVSGSSSVSSVINDSNFVTVKYSPQGALLWSVSYNGGGQSNDVARAITNDASGNIYVAGISLVTGSSNYVTIKYTSAGVQQFVLTYNGPANSTDETSAIFVDNTGEKIYVTGRSIGAGTDFDYATIKYTELVGVKPIKNEAPSDFLLYQNYPNPFNPYTTIRFELHVSSPVYITIYDINGREVYFRDYGLMKIGRHEIQFYGEELNSGVYFCRIQAGTFSATNKMILLK